MHKNYDLKRVKKILTSKTLHLLIHYLFIVCVCVHVCPCAYHTAYMEVREQLAESAVDNLCKSRIFLHHVGPRDSTRVVELHSRCFLSTEHLLRVDISFNVSVILEGTEKDRQTWFLLKVAELWYFKARFLKSCKGENCGRGWSKRLGDAGLPLVRSEHQVRRNDPWTWKILSLEPQGKTGCL